LACDQICGEPTEIVLVLDCIGAGTVLQLYRRRRVNDPLDFAFSGGTLPILSHP
jgi:hypothetical protein